MLLVISIELRFCNTPHTANPVDIIKEPQNRKVYISMLHRNSLVGKSLLQALGYSAVIDFLFHHIVLY